MKECDNAISRDDLLKELNSFYIPLEIYNRITDTIIKMPIVKPVYPDGIAFDMGYIKGTIDARDNHISGKENG